MLDLNYVENYAGDTFIEYEAGEAQATPRRPDQTELLTKMFRDNGDYVTLHCQHIDGWNQGEEVIIDNHITKSKDDYMSTFDWIGRQFDAEVQKAASQGRQVIVSDSNWTRSIFNIKPDNAKTPKKIKTYPRVLLNPVENLGNGEPSESVTTFRYAYIVPKPGMLSDGKIMDIYIKSKLPIKVVIKDTTKEKDKPASAPCAIVEVNCKRAKQYGLALDLLREFLALFDQIRFEVQGPNIYIPIPGLDPAARLIDMPAPGLPFDKWKVEYSALKSCDPHQGILFAPNSEELKDAVAQQKWIIQGILPANHYMMIGASEKNRKSFFAIQTAIRVATGTDFLGCYKTAKCKVMYVDLENGHEVTVPRIDKMKPDMALPEPSLVDENIRLVKCEPNLVKVFEILDAKGFEPKLIIIDPIYALIEDEISAKEAKEFVRKVKVLNNLYKAAVILIHHTNKGTNNSQVNRDNASDKIAGSNVYNRGAHSTLVYTLHEPSDKMPMEHGEMTIRGRSGKIKQSFTVTESGVFTLSNATPKPTRSEPKKAVEPTEAKAPPTPAPTPAPTPKIGKVEQQLKEIHDYMKENPKATSQDVMKKFGFKSSTYCTRVQKLKDVYPDLIMPPA